MQQQDARDFVVKQEVSKYYGETLSCTADLKTSACCDATALPPRIAAALSKVHADVVRKYYGCGLCLPPDDLDGLHVLDLGCGAGRDCFILSQLVGASGHVTGIDMTEEQLVVARAHVEHHARAFGYDKSNVTFTKGVIEDLESAGVAASSVDIIVSNCVINLSEDKAAVLAQAHRALKEGGEMYFSDVYADRRIPEAGRTHAIAYGECLGGALYWNDFKRLARNAGFLDQRIVECREIDVHDAQLRKVLGGARFYSATYRLWKMAGMEDACEDYGQAAVYNGSCPGLPHSFALDDSHTFEHGKLQLVCGNTALMLSRSRLGKYFNVVEGSSTRRHFGLFAGCGTNEPFVSQSLTRPNAECAAPASCGDAGGS